MGIWKSRKWWKRKWTHQSLFQCFLHGLMSSVSFWSSCMISFMSCELCLYFCTVLCDWVVLMWQAMLRSNLVHMSESLGMRLVTIWPWPIWFWNKASAPTLAMVLHIYSHVWWLYCFWFAVPRKWSLLYCVATLPLCSYFTSVRCGQEAIAKIVIKVGLTIRNPFTILLDKHL